MRKWIVRLLVLAALAGGGVLLDLYVFTKPPVPVRVAKVVRGEVLSTVTNSRAGTVKARRRAHLSPEASGRVVEIAHHEGERVKKGELLLRLDDTTQKAELLSAQRSLGVAEAQLHEQQVLAARSDRELARNMKLAARGIITADQLDQFQSARAAAHAQVETAAARAALAQAQVQVARVALDKTRLVAPFSAILADVTVDLGEWITPAPPLVPVPSVVDLIDPSSIYVSAPMDEVDSAVIKKGQQVKVTIDAYPGRTFPGTVHRVANYVVDRESQNRTVEIEVELHDAAFAQTLLPGTSADVEVIVTRHEGVLRIPTAALIEGDRVLIDRGGVLVEQKVKVGIKNWDFAEVDGGLKEGEEVVTTLGSAAVKAGAEVVVEGRGQVKP